MSYLLSTSVCHAADGQVQQETAGVHGVRVPGRDGNSHNVILIMKAIFLILLQKKTMSFREYKDTIEENDLGKSNKTENPQFLFIYYHTKKTWFKGGIVSRDFEVLQIIFMKRTWFLDVPLEVYLFLNFRFYIVL